MLNYDELTTRFMSPVCLEEGPLSGWHTAVIATTSIQRTLGNCLAPRRRQPAASGRSGTGGRSRCTAARLDWVCSNKQTDAHKDTHTH